MTVQELIKVLKTFPPDADAMVLDDGALCDISPHLGKMREGAAWGGRWGEVHDDGPAEAVVILG